MNSYIKIFFLVFTNFFILLGFSQEESEIIKKSNELRNKMRRIQTEGIESYNQDNNENQVVDYEDIFENPRMSLTDETANSSVNEDPNKFGKRLWYDQENYPEYYEYKESSCYNELGWSPFVSKEVWDEKYARCEKIKMKNTLRAILFILFIIGGVGSGIYFGFYRKKKV